MTEAMRMNISDSIDRLNFLLDQLEGAKKYSVLNIKNSTEVYYIRIEDWEVFNEIRSIYGLTSMEIIDKRHTDEAFICYDISVKNLMIRYIAMKGDEGYEID